MHRKAGRGRPGNRVEEERDGESLEVEVTVGCESRTAQKV